MTTFSEALAYFRPRLRTLHEYPLPSNVHLHPVLEVVWQADAAPRFYCGDSWCCGRCKLPALTLGKQKAYSSMTACGPVMQGWRVTWTGTTEEIPPEHHERFLKAYWS